MSYGREENSLFTTPLSPSSLDIRSLPPLPPQRRDPQIGTQGQGEGTNSLLLNTFTGGKAAADIYSGAGLPPGPTCWTVTGPWKELKGKQVC